MSQRSPKTRQRQPMRVAVCIDTRDGPGRERLHGVYQFAVGRHWNLLLVRADDANGVRQIVQMGVKGAILFNRRKVFHRQLKRRGILCVETGARNLEFDDAAVFVDDAAVGHLAWRHLSAMGFRHFGYCGTPDTNASSARRLASFRDHGESQGFAVHTFSGGWAAADPLFASLTRWLAALPKPCGILAFDDKIAERVVAACRCADIAMPHDIGVLGVGDDPLICELLEPQLSSIRIPLRLVGQKAGELLEALARKRAVARQQMVQPLDVSVRATTDRLAECEPSVRSAITLLRDRAHEPIGADQIARLVRVPRRTLERHFAEQLGKTLHDVLIEIRLRMAKNLLSRSEEPIGEIARRCGYSSHSAFVRMFEKEVGRRPEPYRRQVRNKVQSHLAFSNHSEC